MKHEEKSKHVSKDTILYSKSDVKPFYLSDIMYMRGFMYFNGGF